MSFSPPSRVSLQNNVSTNDIGFIDEPPYGARVIISLFTIITYGSAYSCKLISMTLILMSEKMDGILFPSFTDCKNISRSSISKSFNNYITIDEVIKDTQETQIIIEWISVFLRIFFDSIDRDKFKKFNKCLKTIATNAEDKEQLDTFIETLVKMINNIDTPNATEYQNKLIKWFQDKKIGSFNDYLNRADNVYYHIPIEYYNKCISSDDESEEMQYPRRFRISS